MPLIHNNGFEQNPGPNQSWNFLTVKIHLPLFGCSLLMLERACWSFFAFTEESQSCTVRNCLAFSAALRSWEILSASSRALKRITVLRRVKGSYSAVWSTPMLYDGIRASPHIAMWALWSFVDISQSVTRIAVPMEGFPQFVDKRRRCCWTLRRRCWLSVPLSSDSRHGITLASQRG